MIGQLSGILLEKNPPQVLIDAHGVGYEVDVPMSTFYSLPMPGEKITLLTHFSVREDGHFLYGFCTRQERSAFRQLLRISGIGARTALAVLSGMSVGDLAQAVTRQEVGPLTRIPGIGKKTAERLLLELKGKFDDNLAAAASRAGEDGRSDILNALLALGYNDKEAKAAMQSIPAGLSVAEGIRLALKSLSRA
ncbi:MAG: Holliday junction branch migration protein RuvA [Candidatus Accumulibacter sp.]|jgi:Holliday junction DNA helicase RuvA|nr:Holliday junction branch migration protein RuvA [Accumulibacter sp.]